MVLRRPYAFLIRYFKLIHLVITALLIFVVMKYRQIYAYLNSVISSSTNRYDAGNYISYCIILVILLAIGLMAIVFLLLKYKDKPRKIYIFLMGGYGVVAVFLFMIFTYMSGFSNEIADAKTIRLYRDIMLIIMLLQYVMIAIMAVRALGFDIKKFDFNRDMQELSATESDSAEVEINTQIDTTNVVRRYEKGKREFGYFFKEFKIYILIIIAIIVIILGFKLYGTFKDALRVYHENQYVGVSKPISITASYYKIEGDNNYVIVDFDVYKQGKKERLNPNNLVLQVGRRKYLPDKNICYNFSTLGTCYKKQYITSNVTNYMVTYSVKRLNIKKAYLVYNDGYDNTYKIKLAMNEA